MTERWRDAEKWAQPLIEYPWMVFLLFYGSGTVALPLVLAQQGRLRELFTCGGFLFWGWGLFCSLICVYMISTTYRARRYLRERVGERP